MIWQDGFMPFSEIVIRLCFDCTRIGVMQESFLHTSKQRLAVEIQRGDQEKDRLERGERNWKQR